MRHIQLQSWTDQHGNLGLILATSNPHDELFADINGGLIAHDLLEHQNGIEAIGSIPDEIEAIGGIWQIRGRHADFCHDEPHLERHWTPEQNTILNLPSLARDTAFGGDWTPRIGQYNTRPHFEDETFRDMLEWVRSHCLAELEEPTDLNLDAFLENALHLIRIGYRKAERRFGSNYKGLDQFRAIKEALKPHCHHLDVEGQTFRLSYGNGCAQVTKLLHPASDLTCP